MKALAHNQAEAIQFLRAFKPAFTTRSSGLSWPKADRTWRHAINYVRGLIRPGDKTITDIGKHVNTDHEPLERFIRESPWEHEQVQEHLHEQVPEELPAEEAALIVDGMAIPKRAERSVGVARQWCGVRGKVDNCQVVVNCVLARPGKQFNANQVTWPLATELYLPKKWAGGADVEYDSPQERERYAELREETGIPEEIGYRPKYEIALAQIERAIDAGIEHGCVVGDTGFGRPGPFRAGLRELDEPYVLEVETGKFTVVPEGTTVIDPGPTEGRGRPREHPTYPAEVSAETPAEIANGLEADDWATVTWNQGSKGPLTGSFSRIRVRVVEDVGNRWLSDETGWLLLKKDHGEEDELKAWICWGLDDPSLEELVDWAQLRWAVERYHQDSKQELGADEYQGRTWSGLHHHLSGVMLAHAFIAERRLDRGMDREQLPSFQDLVREIVRTSAIQDLQADLDMGEADAEAVAELMLNRYSSWDEP